MTAQTKIVQMIEDQSQFVSELLHIQRGYTRGIFTYRDVEREVSQLFHEVIFGYCMFLYRTNFDADFLECDFEEVSDDVVVLLTQKCLFGEYHTEESGEAVDAPFIAVD